MSISNHLKKAEIMKSGIKSMKKKAVKSTRAIEPAIVKAVEGLRLYAKTHPEAGSVRLALDGILKQLVQASLCGDGNQGELDLSLLRLEELAALFPDSPIPFLHLSKICLDNGYHTAALTYAEAGLQLQADYPDLIFNRALALMQTGKNEAGIAGFKRYIELNPDNPWAYNNIGDAYRRLGQYDEAEKHLKMAIERDDRFYPASYNLAMLYMDKKDWASCVHHAQIAEKHGPPDKEVQLALGDGHMGLGEAKSALQHLAKATLINKDFVEAYETMSCAYADLGMYDLAIAAGREALRVKSDSWMAPANMGCAEGKRGRFAEAIKYQIEAMALNPDQEGLYKLCWELGWNYLQIDQYSKALKFTEQAISLKEAPDIILSFNKGLILLAQGKAGEAYEVYHQAMAKACSSDNFQAIIEGIGDLRDFVTKRGIRIDQGSPFLELLAGEFDLLKLLVSSKNWGQEIKPEIFQKICIQGQRVSEEDLRTLRAALKKKVKKGSLH
jgi:tetratricopeptide (TPR) repeat protein